MAKKKATQSVAERPEEIIGVARSLRQSREEADARFLLYLVHVETMEAQLLQDCGYSAFTQFLVNHDLCAPSRYESFKRGLEKLHGNVEQAEQLGANPVIALAKNIDVGAIPKYVSAINHFKKQHKGVAPSLKTSESYLYQVDPRPQKPASTKKQDTTESLRAENIQLKAEVKMLRQENATLRRELSIIKGAASRGTAKRGRGATAQA